MDVTTMGTAPGGADGCATLNLGENGGEPRTVRAPRRSPGLSLLGRLGERALCRLEG